MSTVELRDMSARDIGRTVTITRSGTTIRGPLTDFRIVTDWITQTTMAQDPSDAEPVPGRQTVSLTIGPWSTDRLPLDTMVEVEA